MVISGNSLKVLSANCQGLRDKQKRADVLGILKIKMLIYSVYKIHIGRIRI